MAVGAVECGGIWASRLEPVEEPLLQFVAIQCKDRPACYGLGLPPVVPQVTGNETAPVLCGLPVGLAHLPVFLNGLRGADRVPQPLAKVFPGCSLVGPELCMAAVAVSYG